MKNPIQYEFEDSATALDECLFDQWGNPMDGEARRDGDDPGDVDDNLDPTLKNYASMSRDEIVELLQRPEECDHWPLLQQVLMQKMTELELVTYNHVIRITRFLIEEYGGYGAEQCGFLIELAGEIAAKIVSEMPSRGTPQACN